MFTVVTDWKRELLPLFWKTVVKPPVLFSEPVMLLPPVILLLPTVLPSTRAEPTETGSTSPRPA
jgi:hypothetical protein